jgi:hypothetical protein
MYFSIAPCCQARSLLAVPQGARPGKAGERWWDEEDAVLVAAVVVTVSEITGCGITGCGITGCGLDGYV